jgi:hypothetical protein
MVSRKDVRFIVLDLGCSIIFTVVSFFVASSYLKTPFESFVFSTLVFVGLQVPVLAYRHSRAISALETNHGIIMKSMKTSKNFAPKCKEQDEVVDTLSAIFGSFKIAYDNYDEGKNKKGNCSFFVRLHKAKINDLNDELNKSKSGGWLKVRIEEFLEELPNIFEGNVQDYYETATCDRGIRWFSTSKDAEAYSEIIDEKFKITEDKKNVPVTKDTKKITRILVYKGTDLDAEGEAFYNLNKAKGYQVKKIKFDTLSDVYEGVFGVPLSEDFYDFAMYGKMFVWKKIRQQGGIIRASVSVDNDNIDNYATFFTRVLLRCDKIKKENIAE